MAKACSDRATPRQRLLIDAAYARTIELDLEKDLRILQETVRAYPDEKRAHHRLASHYRAQGRLYQAIEEYTQAIALQPDDAYAYTNRRNIYAYKGEKEKSAVDLKKVLELSKDPVLRKRAEEGLKELKMK